jgi:hypothetical protein
MRVVSNLLSGERVSLRRKYLKHSSIRTDRNKKRRPPVAKTKFAFVAESAWVAGSCIKKENTKSSTVSAPTAARNPKKRGDINDIVWRLIGLKNFKSD